MKKMVLCAAILCSILLSGSAPTPLQDPRLHQELADLARRGITHRFTDPMTIELKEEWSGRTWLKSLREPSEAEIRSWAAARGVPILEIDPTQIDTNQYAGWYTYWTQVPLSNSIGRPLVAADVDRDGKADVYGVFRDFSSQDYGAHVYEIDSTGIVAFGYEYIPRPGISLTVADVDEDVLNEVLWNLAGGVYDYEQEVKDSLPTLFKFRHERHQGNVAPGFTGIHIGFLDSDSLTDFLYVGSEPDSSDTTLGVIKTYIAEFNPDSSNFMRVWSAEIAPGGVAGFAVADFDGDGSMEFVASEIYGHLFLVENTGDNSYDLAWQDSTLYVNLYYQTSGDVDMDGKPEFFVGATMSSGNWTTMYEVDSNDHYSARFIFHLLSGGTLDEPVYLTSDVDGDGKLELIIFSGAHLYVLKSHTDDTYDLWYYKREYNRDAVQFYDLNDDGKEDYLISKLEIDSLGRGRFYANVYKATALVHVQEGQNLPLQSELLQNYPNPFNPSTTFTFSIQHSTFVTLKVYNVLGQEAATVVNDTRPPGNHEVHWDSRGLPSGVYFYRLETATAVMARKMLLMR